MRRPVGVTVWAVLLVLSGLLSGAVALASFSAGPRALDDLKARLSELERLPTGTGEGHLTPEQAVELRRRGDTLLEELGRLMESPQVQGGVWLGVALSLTALSAGIGLLAMQRWARRLAVWQAVAAMPLGLFALAISPQRRIFSATVPFYQGLVPAETFHELQRAMQSGQAIGQWTGVLFLLVWNGLLIWYLHRPSVKAAFASGDVRTTRA